MVKKFLGNAWKRIKKAWPVNRVVTTLTPLVFVPVSGALTAWLGTHFPGLPPMDPGFVTGMFALGAASAYGAFDRWIKGWQKDKIVPKQIVENKVIQQKAPATSRK